MTNTQLTLYHNPPTCDETFATKFSSRCWMVSPCNLQEDLETLPRTQLL